jgi:hypothetical protein
VTVRASITPEPAALIPALSLPTSPTASRALSGVILAGTLGGDVIIVSPRALAIVRAGIAVRAFVIRGLETLRRTIALGEGRTLVLEYGIYRAA